MQPHSQVPPSALAKALKRAKKIVEGHCDPAVPPSERLRQIGEKLNVTRIEAGALNAAGFLSMQADDTFAIYYANDMPERRRFTVAHELAHLILNRYFKHLNTKQIQSPLAGRGSSKRISAGPMQSGLAPHSRALERAVERIAAELLMPEQWVIRLMRGNCRVERESSLMGVIDKRTVLRAVGKELGVSESALVLRLLELTEIRAVRIQFEWAKQGLFGDLSRNISRIGVSCSKGLQIESYQDPSQSNLEGKDGWELPVRVKVAWGKRTIRCQGWQRPPRANDAGLHMTWVVGWTWNSFPRPNWDDSVE
jgi:Zn-dependent peptidase ImmA (M78 family)